MLAAVQIWYSEKYNSTYTSVLCKFSYQLDLYNTRCKEYNFKYVISYEKQYCTWNLAKQ
jgi:hypothetical protein